MKTMNNSMENWSKMRTERNLSQSDTGGFHAVFNQGMQFLSSYRIIGMCS